ncbi:hypothetical protein RRG08_000077, partial [Elysia crispata]
SRPESVFMPAGAGQQLLVSSSEQGGARPVGNYRDADNI